MCSAGYCGMCGTGLHRGVLLFYKKVSYSLYSSYHVSRMLFYFGAFPIIKQCHKSKVGHVKWLLVRITANAILCDKRTISRIAHVSASADRLKIDNTIWAKSVIENTVSFIKLDHVSSLILSANAKVTIGVKLSTLAWNSFILYLFYSETLVCYIISFPGSH